GCDSAAGFSERGNLGGSRAFAPADNGARVAHAAPRRRGRARDKTGDRLFAVALDPLRRFLFGAAADFPDHDDAVRAGIVVEHLDDVDRKSTRLNSSHQIISYAVFCLKKT